MKDQKPLPAGIPEEAGIPSAAFIQFLNALERSGVNMHGFVAIRGGKTVAEGYWKPYHKEAKHRMASCTKSFTSIAVGCMADEGLITLSDRIVDYFPEKIPPEGVHPYIARTTIRDLLMMSSAHESTTYGRIRIDDWLSTIFTCPPTHIPGTVFSYDTSATQALCTLISKLTGMPLLTYLRPRLLDPIGFSEDAYCLTDPVYGLPWGGSGLVCTTMDLAKVAFVCMREGEYEGRQLIPKWYIKEATAMQISNSLRGNHPDIGHGYGYQIWRFRNNGFAFLGLGGQMALCFPDKDMVLAFTAAEYLQNSDFFHVFTALWDWLYPNLSDNPLPVDKKVQHTLREKLESLEIPVLKGRYQNPMIDVYNGIYYEMNDNKEGYKSFVFNFDSNIGVMRYEKENGWYSLRFGFGAHQTQEFPETGNNCIASAEWPCDDALNICCHMIGESAHSTLRITICFKESKLTVGIMKAKSTPQFYNGAAGGRRRNSE